MRVRAGQTLLEGLIAIFVIVVGLMAIIGLAISNQAAAQSGADATVATNLAREALEIVKFKRDSAWLAGEPFSQRLLTGSGFVAIPQSQFFSDENGDTRWNLLFRNAAWDSDQAWQDPDAAVRWSDQGHYDQVGGSTPTKYKRLLHLEAICRTQGGVSFAYRITEATTCETGEALVGIQATAAVRWRRGLTDRTVTLQTRLFDWR